MRDARQCIFDIIKHPEKHQGHAKKLPFFNPLPFPLIPHLIIISVLFYRYSASVVISIGYGKESKPYQDPDIRAVNRCLTRLGNTLWPGVWKVDMYPFHR